MSLIHLTVSEFNQIMGDIIHNQLNLNQLCIEGEVSQFNLYAQKKHLYLTLKQDKASLQCVIYNQSLSDVPVITLGDTCQIIGKCQFLKNKGQLIFSGVKLILTGKGAQQKAFEQLKQTFETNGWLSKQTPTNIPRMIQHVCIITAPTSAAFHDMHSIISTNAHTFKTTIIPATMQGILAPESIQDALNIAQSLTPDIICISRGGGSADDFTCFNDKTLCHTIAHSTTPIITGIGHQINTTLACLCANKSVETPTALAQYLCTHSMQPITDIETNLTTIAHSIDTTIHQINHYISQLKTALLHGIKHSMHPINQSIDTCIHQLSLLNPIETLKKGYSYCTSSSKKQINSIQQMKKNDIINITFWNGEANATINHVNTKRS